MKRESAIDEARSRVRWGDPTSEIRAFLLEHEFTGREADDLLADLAAERRGEIRRKGIVKLVLGILLALVPVVTYFIMAGVGLIMMRLLALTGLAGLYGLWQALDGLLLLVRPSGHQGALSSENY